MKQKVKIILAIGVTLLVIGLLIFAAVYFGVLRPKWEQEKEYAQMLEGYRQRKFSFYQKENEKYEDYQVDAAFLGDSLIDGYDLTKYYSQYTTANRGIVGDTTFTLEDRMQLSAYDLKPKILVLLIGANNLDTMFDNYEDILDGIQTNLPNTKVILVSLTAMGKDWAKDNSLASENNLKIQALANQFGYTYVDLFTPMYDDHTGEANAEYCKDGIHLTAQGYQLFTDTVTPVIEAMLAE